GKVTLQKNAVSHVTDGLVLHLDAANTNSYPGTGTTWTDLTGGGPNGTLASGAVYDSINGGAILFDGNDDRVEFSASSDFNFSTSDFAVEIWFYLTGNAAANSNGLRICGLFANCPINNINGVTSLLQIQGDSTTTGTGLRWTRNVSPAVNVDRTVSISQQAWHQVVVTRIGTNLNFYLDGFQLGSPTTDSSPWGSSSNNARLGYIQSQILGYKGAFPGYIPIVRIYKGKGLTAEEVQQNFNANRGRYGV
ncbi:MAG: LamG-like jellyroll fold domain-containing protein, partial [Candidatus Nanopelagicaceae bacterium]